MLTKKRMETEIPILAEILVGKYHKEPQFRASIEDRLLQ